MQKKKILFIITKGNWGGAQRYVFDLATFLPREKYEVTVAVGEGSLLEKKLTSIGIRTIKLSHLKETRRAGLQTTDAAAFVELLRLFKKEQPDIIHLNSSRTAILGTLAFRCFQLLNFLTAKSYKLKAVFTVHGWPFKEPRPFVIRSCIWIASYITALLSHRTIVLSTGDKELGERMPGISRKLSLIYNGIEKIDALSKEEARKKLSGDINNAELWIGTIAELNPNKGIAYLVEAMALLPNTTRLCIIGDGTDRQALEASAISLHISSRVIFAGTVEQASAYLTAFDIFALPSLKEGLPYSILEAGMQGIPVVGTDISGIRDIIIRDERMGILVPHDNPKSLAAALQMLIEHETMRREFGHALKQRVTQNFSLGKMLAQTDALYHR